MTRLRTLWRSSRTTVLSVLGFGCVDYAAFEVHLVAGLITTGVSLLALEYLGRSDRA